MKKGIRILMALMKLDIGGAETHVVELAKELRRRGAIVYIASNGGAFEDEIREAGITHIKVPLHNKNPFNMWNSYKLLEKIIIDEKIEIVHSHARIPSFILGKLYKKHKFPFVTTAHWVFTTKYGLKYITDWGQKTIAVSDDIKEYLKVNYNIPDDDIFVTINGIDTDKFSPEIACSSVEKEFKISDSDFVITAVSRLDADRSKASKQLIEISPKLSKTIPNLVVLVVGGGNDEKNVIELAKKANDEIGRECVLLTGARTDINKLCATSDLFVGVSRAALEAMATKTACVIAGNEGYIGLFNESLLKVGIDTNFCCRGCAETTSELILSDILKYYKLSDSEKEKLSDYARNTVMKYYSVSKMADDAICAYEAAMKH